MEDWVTIKTLRAKHPEMSLREIARLVQTSPNTVKNALERTEAPSYQRRERNNPLLEPFKETILELVTVKHLRGSRILEEIRSKGYRGGATAFYAHLQQIKPEVQNSFMPYETLPGEQSQFDWSPYTPLIGGELTRIIVYSYINSFSRYWILEGSLAENQPAVLEALEDSLIASGGVPQRVQTDNAKAFVHNPSRRSFQWNERYLAFCGHYGFQPSRSLPGHPWSKGKVERPFAYLEDHFIAGNSFESFEDFILKLHAFQEKANAREHATLKTRPDEMIAKDREAFSPLPESRYVGVKEESRKVTGDCLLSYNGSRYSVPWMFAGKYVWLRLSRGYYLQIYSSANVLVAQHRLSLRKGAVIIEKSHYRTHPGATAAFDRLCTAFIESFPGQEIFLEKLRAQKRFNARHHLSQMLELARVYHRDDFLKAIAVSLEYNVFTSSFMSGYLEKHFQHTFDLPSRDISPPSTTEVVTRDLRDYTIPEDAKTHPSLTE
jgi:transposase